MKSIPLQVCFKGKRDYLQGGDLCNAIMEEVRLRHGENISGFSVSFHRFISRQPDAYWASGNEPSAKPPTAAAQFAGTGVNGVFKGWLLESDRPVECRVPFDEDQIARHCSIADRSISIRADTGYLPIEVIVSMTKQLHNRTLNAAAGRWIFTKVELRRLLEPMDAQSITITLKETLYSRLTKSEIVARGITIGVIYFSLTQ